MLLINGFQIVVLFWNLFHFNTSNVINQQKVCQSFQLHQTISIHQMLLINESEGTKEFLIN